jgi:hypothetical protein
MSREYHSKRDIIDTYLEEGRKFELAYFCVKPNQPSLFHATFLGFDEDTNELQYQVQGNVKSWVDLDEVLQIGRNYSYSTFS